MPLYLPKNKTSSYITTIALALKLITQIYPNSRYLKCVPFSPNVFYNCLFYLTMLQ